MISISRSMLLAAGLLAFPLAGAVAQAVDTGKSTGPSSVTTGNHKVDAENAKAAMKSTAPGYMSTGEIHGATGKLSENAATGQSGKKPATP
jgi:hypothetical protein